MKIYVPYNQPPYFKIITFCSDDVLDATVAGFAPQNLKGRLGKSVSALYQSAVNDRGSSDSFRLDGVAYLPAIVEPEDLFFCWIYIRSLLENNDLAIEALSSKAFSDDGIPGNCPGKALAMFSGLITSLEDPGAPYEQFIEVVCPE